MIRNVATLARCYCDLLRFWRTCPDKQCRRLRRCRDHSGQCWNARYPHAGPMRERFRGRLRLKRLAAGAQRLPAPARSRRRPAVTAEGRNAAQSAQDGLSAAKIHQATARRYCRITSDIDRVHHCEERKRRSNPDRPFAELVIGPATPGRTRRLAMTKTSPVLAHTTDDKILSKVR